MERRHRRWWTRSVTWISATIVFAALLSGLFQLAVLMAPGYRNVVAREASRIIGQPVAVDGLSLRWRWLWPLLELDGVHLLDEQQRPVLDAGRIRLGFALGELLRGNWVPADIEVASLALTLQVQPDGRLHWPGLPQSEAPPDFAVIAKQLQRFSRLRAQDVTLTVEDQRPLPPGLRGVVPTRYQGIWSRIDLRLGGAGQGFELRAELQAPQALAERVVLRAGLSGDLTMPAQWQGRWTVEASGLVPSLWARYWPALAGLTLDAGSLSAAGDWTAGHLGSSELSFTAHELHLPVADHPPAQLRSIDLGLHYRVTDQGGVLELAPFRITGSRGVWPASTAHVEWQRPLSVDGREAARWNVHADFLRLDDLVPWVAALWPPPAGHLHPETLRSLRGDVTELELRRDADGHGAVHARFADLGGSWPERDGERGSVLGLSGVMSGDETGGTVQVDGDGAHLDLPAVFEQTLHLERLQAEARWQRGPEGWSIALPSFAAGLMGAECSGSATLLLPANGGSPHLQLKSRIDAQDAARLKPLMPKHWSESLRSWLQRALVRARVAGGSLVIDGPVADFPYHHNPTGHWSLDLPIRGARLDYHPDWPGAEPLDVLLHFTGNGLRFESQKAAILGVAVTGLQGQIADFAASPLLIDGKTEGDAARYFAFLRASPLAAHLQGLLVGGEASGPAQADVHLEIPLHSESGQKTVANGEVRLLGNRLQPRGLDAPVQDITGSLRFGAGLSASDLRGRFYDTPVEAHIAANGEGRDELTVAAEVDLSAAQGLAAHYVPDWLRRHLPGRSDWRLTIPLAGPHAGHVRLSSDLRGVASTLPTPFAKAAADALPLQISIDGDDHVPLHLGIESPDRLALSLRYQHPGSEPPAPHLPLQLRGVALRFGTGDSLPDATEDGLRLSGALPDAEPAEWLELLRDLPAAAADADSASPAAAPLPFLGATVSVQHLRFSGYELQSAQVQARPAEGGGYVASVQATDTEGSVQLAPRGERISSRWSALSLQPLPAPTGVDAHPPRVGEPLDPTRAPVLDIAVDALHIGGQDFGKLQLATERTADGQRLRHASVNGGIIKLDAEGEWRRSQGQTEAQSRFSLTSSDLAATLQGLGFAPTVSGRGARIAGDLVWPAAARGFDWAMGRGTVEMEIEHGNLRMVDPGGTSRVLGLFNFYALPRRLALDFHDVVSQGLGFDHIEGRFQLADGVAHTDDLQVKGPSLKMTMKGDVGLAAHTYDQAITVTPNTSGVTLGALLVGGATVGATVVAAPILPLIAVIANQVIDKPLEQVTQLSYRLTGSWDNPEIQKLDASGKVEKPADSQGKQ